jgi:hypothetical protein
MPSVVVDAKKCIAPAAAGFPPERTGPGVTQIGWLDSAVEEQACRRR